MKKIFLIIILTVTSFWGNAQINYCDSIEMVLTPHQPNIIIFSTNIPTLGIPGTIDYLWVHKTIDGTIFLFDTNESPMIYMPNPTITDTVIVCLIINLNILGVMDTCHICDTLEWDGQWIPWVNPSSIEEMETKGIIDNKMYDLLGRELTKIPVGVMYIRNQKKYIRIR